MTEQKVSILTLLIMLILVSVISVLGTTYLVVKLGLVQYPSQGTASSTGIVTLNVMPPAEVTIQGGKVLVNIINNTTAGGSASPP